MSASALAAFAFIGNIAGDNKPLMGNFVDAFPLFGTHRRHYRLLSLLASGILWILMGVVPKTFAWLLTVNIAFYVSIVMSALMVEAGQRHQATGRLSAQRVVFSRLETLIATSLGAFLAKLPFHRVALAPAAANLPLYNRLYRAYFREPYPARDVARCLSERAGVRN